jgi:pimeloyl-ACP methyl ester carboxylesterase
MFYHFIKTELKPYIERTYRTDTTNRTLMGHSLGGYFVLYALLKEAEGDGLFNNYVAASPSIWYHDYYILQQFQNLSSANRNQRKLKLYLTTGQIELAEDPANSFNYFGQILGNRDFIHVMSRVYKNLEHMGTAVLSFEDGLALILSARLF